MKKTLAVLALLSISGFAPGFADSHGLTVEEVIARHIEAKGGDAWDEVRTMRITGEFTAFSELSQFTIHRARERRYRIDHTMNERRVNMGYDGALRWVDSEWGDGGPQPMTNTVDLLAFERELDFATPLFDVERYGYEVRLLPDREEIEGFSAIAIELKRGDDSVETWFLDLDTYLELARESPGSDFGQPQLATTFFDDFRQVEGVMIPHYVETQWYTRHRVQNIQTLEINADFDDSVFRLPIATGMENLQNMLGEWSVKVESKRNPRQEEFTETSHESVITASLNGGLIEERYATESGLEAMRTWSYDRYRDQYVMTQMNDAQTFLDIQTGALEDGALKVSNVETGTSFSIFGAAVHERCTVSAVMADSFTIERERSTDGGQNWALRQRLTYTRKDR